METLFFDISLIKALPRKVDVVVGIPSYNNESTIANVASIAAKGIDKYLKLDSLILNSDGSSKDLTRNNFMNSNTGKIPKFSYTYKGISGKGSAMLSIMEVARILEAKVVIFVDSDLRSIKPWWFERLAVPILNGDTDYITPYYIRHKYDGTITNQVCYPLTSSLYGQKIRQPIGGDFGVGKKMIDVYTSKVKEVMDTKICQFGIDIWMTTTAICESDKKIWQAALGSKIHDVKDPGKHLGPMFDQVVSTVFKMILKYKNIWKDVDSLRSSPVYGEIPEIEVEPLNVDLQNLKEKAFDGLQSNSLSRKLAGNHIDNILKHKRVSLEQWIDIIFNTIREFKNGNSEVVNSLIPLYFGRVADFIQLTKDLDSIEAENLIEKQVNEFFSRKQDLLHIV